MKFLYFQVVIGIFLQNLNVQGGLISDVVSSGGTIVEGLIKEIPKILPTPEELFQLPIQDLIGLPEVAVFGAINQLCSVYLAGDTIKPRVTPDVNKMSLHLRTPCQEFIYYFNEIENLLDSPEFDVNKKVAIFIPGWNADTEKDYVIKMAEAFKCRDDYNFLAYNTSGFIDTLYTWSSYNTEEVGRELAEVLVKLTKEVPAENIHLIGHSLGAHVAGYAGRYFSKIAGVNLTRITGLDPANPCFNEGESLTGIQRGDAEFIDIIHSNPGVFGKREPVGDVDFYAGGLAPIKPGCVLVGCSHGRSVYYFIETVYPGNEDNFLGVRCTSLTKVEDDFCQGPKFPMGLAVPFDLKGNYFLAVNAEPPYGKNNEGRNAVPRQCKTC